MSYYIKGEIVIDVEDYHYNGDIGVKTDAQGICEMMEDNNISLSEVCEEHIDDDYKQIDIESVCLFLGTCDFIEATRCQTIIMSQMKNLYNKKLERIVELKERKVTSITESDNNTPAMTN